MALAAEKILIVGGGFSGMAAAIQLSKVGATVELVESDSQWRSYGAGISIAGPTLRAFGELGILEEFLQRGATTNGIESYSADGRLLVRMPVAPIAGVDVPGIGGVMRPVLSAMLAAATRAAGVEVRLGCSFEALSSSSPVEDEEGVQVDFSDGSYGRYDLVVGADGLNSDVRAAIFPNAPTPQYVGQGAWRAVLPRPPGLTYGKIWHGESLKAGINPVSSKEMYMFVTENKAMNERVDPDQAPRLLADLLEAFPAAEVQRMRQQVRDSSLVVYRPLESLLLPLPWHSGAVVLIGDAVHATTPHLAMGAGIGMEDSIVLAQELAATDGLSAALERFEQRRWERCRMVVENSGRLCDMEINGGDMAEYGRIMQDTSRALAGPI